MSGQDHEVLISLARMEGKLDALLATDSRHEQVLSEHKTQISGLQNQVTAIESVRKASPPWWVTVGALVPTVALLLVVAEALYGGAK